MDFNNIKPLLELIEKVNTIQVISQKDSVFNEVAISSLISQEFIGSYYGLKSSTNKNNIWIGFWEKYGYCVSFHISDTTSFINIEQILLKNYAGYCVNSDSTRGGRWYTIQLNSLNSSTYNEVTNACIRIEEIINNIKGYL